MFLHQSRMFNVQVPFQTYVRFIEIPAKRDIPEAFQEAHTTTHNKIIAVLWDIRLHTWAQAWPKPRSFRRSVGCDLCMLQSTMGDANSPGNLQRKILGTGRKKSRNLDNIDKSLACFTSALQGSPIIVELRNSTFVRGTLYMSDTFMKYDSTDFRIDQEGCAPCFATC